MKKLLGVSSWLSIVVGLILVIGGFWAISFTHKNIAEEKIVTPSDASIPNVPLSGPRTLKAQADVIRKHVLEMTGGLTYAEMPRQVPQLDASDKQVIGSDGKPVMVANSARDIWITATTLITALHLAIFAYVFSGLIVLLGLISIWTGIVFCTMSRRAQ